jgi:hypothetical protein
VEPLVVRTISTIPVLPGASLVPTATPLVIGMEKAHWRVSVGMRGQTRFALGAGSGVAERTRAYVSLRGMDWCGVRSG